MKTSATSHRTPTVGSLEQRVANQERRINQGVRAGTLTKEEASGLRDRLHQAQQNFEKDGFQSADPAKLQEQQKLLNGLSKDIRSAKHDDTIDPQARLDDLDRRIAQGTKDGSLTADEASGLQQTASELRGQLESATTDEAKQALTQKLGDLSKQVHDERHDGELDVDKRMESFKQRIEAGVKDGSLTAQEAMKLTGKMFGVEAGARLGDQVDAQRINQFSRAIFRNRHDRQLDAGAMSQSLGGKLDALSQNANVDQSQVSALRDQLQSLSSGDQPATNARLNILREQIRALSI